MAQTTTVPPAVADLTPGLRRAAVALIAMGKERAAKVLSHMEADEVAALTRAVLSIGVVGADEVRSSLVELADSLGQLSALTAPNLAWMAETLTAALGPEAGPALLADITRPEPFAWLASVEPDVLARVLDEEAAASVAVALSHATPELGAALLRRLEPAKRAEVSLRLAALDTVSQATVREIDAALFEQVGTSTTETRTQVDGVAALTSLLTRSPRATTDAVLERLAETDPALAAKVKEAMFTFEDVLALEPRAVQKVLAGADVATLALALFGAPAHTSELVFANITEKTALALREEIEFATTVRAADARAARATVVARALEMEAAGEIVIDFGADEEDAA